MGGTGGEGERVTVVSDASCRRRQSLLSPPPANLQKAGDDQDVLASMLAMAWAGCTFNNEELGAVWGPPQCPDTRGPLLVATSPAYRGESCHFVAILSCNATLGAACPSKERRENERRGQLVTEHQAHTCLSKLRPT